MKRILLLIDSASGYDRKLLKGLVQYSREHGPWIFHRVSSAIGSGFRGGRAVIDWARKWKADAIVGRWQWGDSRQLSSLGIPVVLQNYNSRSENFSNLTGDYVGTGIIAAQFFLKRRYSSFAYFGLKDVVWSQERLQGFQEEVIRGGGAFSSCMVSDANKERGKVVDWIHSLPIPTAILACDDAYALYLTELCQMEGVSIPDELALLGVDDDDLLCQISDPQISSIRLNVEQGGYRLGELLDKQFRSKDYWSFNIVVSPGEVVERESTRKQIISDPYVARLVRYVNENFDKFITTDQVFAQVPLSRRSVEIRFSKEMGGMTVYKYLVECRMQKFAQLLSMTDLSMMEIAEKCGVIDYSNVARVFRRVYSCSPQEYRTRRKMEQKLQ